MKPRIGLALLAALLLAAGLAIVLRLGGERSDPVAAAPGAPVPAAEPGADPPLAAGEAVASEADTPARARELVETEEGASETAVLVVRVRWKHDEEPVAGVPVLVRPVGQGSWEAASNKGNKAGSGEIPTTDSAGLVELRLPANREYQVAQVAGRRIGEEGRVGRLEPGERRVLVLHLEGELDLRMFVRVVSALDDTPIARARVMVDLRSSTVPDDSRAQASTDVDGRAELWAPSWKPVFGELEAEGFGWTYFSIQKGHEHPEAARELRLLPTATVRGLCLGAFGDPLEGVRVTLRTDSWNLRTGGDVFVLGGVFRGGEREWVGTSDRDGRFELEELPATVRLEQAVDHGERTVGKTLEPLVLEPGEEREVTYRVGSGTTLAGILLDQHGHPVAGSSVWLVVGDRPRYFSEYQQDRVDEAKTDREGRFAFEDVGPGSWLVGAGPDGEAAPYPTPVEIVAGTDRVDVQVFTHRGLYVRGIVLGPDGEPGGGVRVFGRRDLGILGCETGADGRFELGPLMPGALTLRAMPFKSGAAPAPVEVRAGDEDVVLQLLAEGAISGTVTDGVTGEGVRAQVTTMRAEASLETHPVRFQSAGADGGFEVDGLEPGRYTVSAAVSGNRSAFRTDIVVVSGATTEHVVLELREGATLTILPDGDLEGWIRALQDGRVVGYVFPGGAGMSLSLPPGRITVQQLDTEEILGEWTVDLAPGESGTLDLSDGE